MPVGFEWSFVALEYYALILNRVYLLCIGRREIAGIYMGGPIAALPFPESAWQPGFWVSERRLRKYDGVDVREPGFRWRHLGNFQYPRATITGVRFNAKPKWGMASVPYSGRIHIDWPGRSREFILLGAQDGPGIRDRLLPSTARVSIGADNAIPRPVFDLTRPLIVPG